jgi:hypothetical protein
MGYTHYFEYAPESITPMQAMMLCQDVRQIVDASGVAITGWDSNGNDAPEYNPESRISFNGVGADGHETFSIDFHAPIEPDPDDPFYPHKHFVYDRFIEHDRRVWSFCKTAAKPYDAVVCASLLRAVDLIPGFAVLSDGSWTYDEWVQGRNLYFNVFGQEPVCPWEHD